MNSTAIASAEITIDDHAPLHGDFHLDQEIIRVRSATATKPDPGWEQVDEAGHFHAYDTEGKLPTLIGKSRHIDCDGSCGLDDGRGCEGYDVTDWYCRICDQEIQPARLDASGEHSIPGPKSWYVMVRTDRVIDGEVTVQVRVPGQVRFGVAVASMESMEFSDGRMVVTTRLIGIGPLGRRLSA